MSRYKKDLGDFGEFVAEKYFAKQGFRILEKKFTISGGELDLIVESDCVLVFVEVKTRSNMNFGAPSEAINQKKLFHMKRTAEAYLLLHPCDKEIRFDAFEVYACIVCGEPQLKKVNHIPGIIF